uniref:FACT complex subunit n=1 Tax=Entomoneis paludosa TaxID=265537 RepID=A0A7S2V990_9STRA
MAELEVDRFFTRLEKLHSHFIKHNAAVWGAADCLCLNRGPLDEDSNPYLKSAIFHQWIFGYELPDTIVLLTKEGEFYILATKKKCDFIRDASANIPKGSPIKKIHLLLRNKEDSNEENYTTLWKAGGLGSEERKLGVILKERETNVSSGGILGPWESKLTEAQEAKEVTLVDVAAGLSFAMSIKDESELDLMKRSSILSNKVMKHGYIKKMEDVIDSGEAITHEALASYVDEILENPSKIGLKVAGDDVQSCYYPIVQSGGNFDLKASAQSSEKKLSHDVIMVSLGARYRNYCSNIGRTFLVDPPKKVSENYELLLEMQEACLEVMRPGKPAKAVYKAAVSFLQDKDESLVKHLPKTLGFASGLDFRDSSFLLSAKNPASIREGMVFCLNVGLQNLELSESDRSASSDKSPVKKLSSYALMIADMVAVTKDGPDVMTKMPKALTNVAYKINDEEDDGDDDESEEEEDDAPDAPKGDAELARKLANESRGGGTRTSSRLARDSDAMKETQEGIAQRERKQILLMRRRNEERVKELARKNRNKSDGDGEDQAEELETYKRTRDYPDPQPNQVMVHMANQCVFLPISGVPVPFHISTIKNVVMPEADGATLLRINFYTAGIALGKEAPANMIKLVQKYAPYASFIREMTFRSLDGRNLTHAFRQISELRRRARAKELREQEEADLVEQEKLVRTRGAAVPRLSDLTMRPVVSARKTQGSLEAHTNGLRFTSVRNEIVDIMYANIKYAIFQPCESEIMVLVHFHLKNPIMIGKVKRLDVQFFTEVIDSSQAVDNSRRSMYDPDEMDDEQRERQLRKKLNGAFRDFCRKVDAVAKKNNYHLEFDVPYRDLGFTGNPHKEMVTIMPTLNCLVNLTETPFFVVDLDEVDHVHFERVTYMSKAFDIVLVNKDFNKPPWRVDMIPNGDKDAIQEWLTDMELTYTEGPMNLNWKQIVNTVKEDDRFYMNTEEDELTEKEAGWEFLRMFGKDDDDDDDPDEDDSEFGSDRADDEDDDGEEEEDFDSGVDEDGESDFDADEDLEEEGLDWDEMEEQAKDEDRRKRRMDDGVEEEVRKPKRGNTNKKRRR